MDVEEYYCRLRNSFPTIPEREPIVLSMERICEILSCTRRNVQILLTKMSEKHYVEWMPGRGRGNVSKIMFLVSYRDIVLGKAKGLVEKGKINEAWSMLEVLQDPKVKSEVMAWLSDLFGVKRDLEEKDTLRFPFYRPILHLDPAYVFRRMETHWIEQVFNTLVRYSNIDGKFHPQLAHYWESNETKTSWTFFLRKGVRFHHDKLMTSRDVAFTFQRLLTCSPSEWMTSMIKDIKETGKYSITFELNEPNALFLHILSTERYSIVPEWLDGTGSAEKFALMPIGTGPFKITKNNESMLVAEANEHYLEGCPHLDRIEMWVWPNYEQNLDHKLVDRDEQLVYFEGQIKENLSSELKQVEKGSTFITFNTAKNSIMQQLKFRQALHFGIDRQRMIRELGGIRHQPSSGFITQETDVDARNVYDKKLAIDLLKQTDYHGETLTLYTYEMTANEQSAKWLQEAYKLLGVTINIVMLSIEELAKPEIIAQADMILSGEVLGEQPDISLIEMYMSKNSFITNHLAPLDKMKVYQQISNCLRNENLDARMGYLISIQEELKRNCSLLFLYHSLQIAGHHRALQGISLNAWGKIDYKNVWFRNI